MRRIDNYAKENFDGNMEKALEYLLYNDGGRALNDFVDELTSDEATFVFKLMRNEAEKFYGGKDNFQNELEKNKLLLSFDLTEDEVRNAPKNPYKAVFLKSCLKMLIMEGGIIFLSIVANNLGIDSSSLGIATSIATGLLSTTVVSNLIDYVKFNKLKNMVDNKDNDTTLESNNKRRSL